ncbi:hypothetical protein JG687_00008998 [Phytophthora cactorum]|uniref:C2H2-type domain-containing protein n=1 Tax=Phytophthora cactorum TaxID=29920 RepID=A0A8T1UCE1_9STRA|nr:hypothetical protein JG687_00008998 [Phytophthora cactorum]
MSEADLDDVYASDEYEPESPTRLQPSPTHAQQSPVLSAAVPTFQLDANLPDDDESEFGAVTPLPREKSKRGTPRESNALSGRHLMDNTPWTYTVSALQVRMLRIPVVDSAAIRELRVFATIDKQAAQSRGSRWKQELHSVGGGSPLRSTKKRGKRNKSLRRVEPYRRSGLIEEAKWMRADGKLQWTFPMERFRRLKAYAPRIKAFVYGIGEAGAVNHSRAQMENLARQEKDGAILSFGWFFLDLRFVILFDIEIPGGYSLRYLNPFLSSAPVTSDWFTVKDKGELESLSFYCMFNLTKNPLQLKQEMQESVRIDLISSDEETVGSAVFSMSYLYFSEEHFCCSEDSCGEIFKTQSETEAHWLEVHTDSKLPDTQAGPEAYSHSYRSCSINIPIVSADISNGSAVQQPRRVGSIRVSAFLEDIGLLTEKHAAAQRAVLTLSSPPLQEKVNIKEETLDESRLHEDVSAKKVREQSTGTSVLREAEETSRNTPATRGVSTVEVSADNSHEEERARQLREREKEAAQLKETLERERSAWKQEQHLQQLQWKRRFAEMEKARMDELEEEWARREEERSNLLKVAQEEYQRLEQTLRKSLADLETRERRLAVAESALQREQEAKRDENDSLQRRLKSEQSHTLSLAKKQTEAYERRIALLESQLSDAERRAKQVEADFAEYRQQQRKLPESKLREEIAALKGNVSELEKQKMAKERECEIAEANIGKMKAQVDQMAGLLNREKKKHEARVVDELEKLRVKYIAREEKYVLDGDRDELRAIKKQLDDLKGYKLRGNGGKRRFHRQRSHESPSPQHHRNHWHTQSRQTAFVHHSRSSSEHYHPGSSFHSDHAYGDASDWEASSCVEIRRVDTTPQLTSREPQGEREYSSSRSHIFNHEGSLATDNFDTDQDQGELEDSEDTHGGPPDTELGRLLRERKLLLDSGAYDAQSYLVRELDRLISVTKAKAGHQRSVA